MKFNCIDMFSDQFRKSFLENFKLYKVYNISIFNIIVYNDISAKNYHKQKNPN